MLIAVLITVSLVCAVICHLIARYRQANAVFWSVMGFAFGPLAVPFAFMAKPVQQNQVQ